MFTRILLSVTPPLISDSFRASLAEHRDLLVIDEAADPISLLAKVGYQRPDVLLCVWPDEGQVANLASHLLMEFPDMRVLSLRPETGKVLTYRPVTHCQVEPATSLDQVLAALRVEQPVADTRLDSSATPFG